ncbi:MAG: dCTP deaminase [Candidatus Micrarchaeia archaeon]|jgi:dCTP deaminase
MMLSDDGIKKAVKKRELEIIPYYDYALLPSAYVMHLGKNFLRPARGKTIDAVHGPTEKYYKPFSITDAKPLRLKPGEFVLGETMEKIRLSNKLGLMIEGVSALGRLGVTAVMTAMLVDSGHGWFKPRAITLEIKNQGPNTIILRPGMKFCRCVFFRLETPATFYSDAKSKYAFQEGVGAPKPLNEFGV